MWIFFYGNKIGAGPAKRMQLDPATLADFQYFQDRKDFTTQGSNPRQMEFGLRVNF